MTSLFVSCGGSSGEELESNSNFEEKVLIEEKKITSITETDQISLIAVGNEDVPVGRYGKEILEAMCLWSELEGKISYASNVKEVLTQVELGSVDCGIVYRSDAKSSDKVEIVEIFDSSLLKSPVVYPAAMLANSAFPQAVECFLDFLTTETAYNVFSNCGFTVIATEKERNLCSLEPCTLTIFAATSLTESLTVLCDAFEREHDGVNFLISFNSSGTLATQIEFGATVDIFISASNSEMVSLTEANLIKKTDIFPLLANEIVLIRAS